MITVDVVAVAAVLGMTPGDRRTVEDSPAVRAAIAGGKLRELPAGQDDGEDDGGQGDGADAASPAAPAATAPRTGRGRHPAGTRRLRDEAAEVRPGSALDGGQGDGADLGGAIHRDGSAAALGGAEGHEGG